MTSITSNAISGLLNSQQRVEKSAVKVAIADTDPSISTDAELVNIEAAKNDFAANATVLKVSKQLTDKLLDILA